MKQIVLEREFLVMGWDGCSEFTKTYGSLAED